MDTVVGFSGEDTGFFFRFTREGFGIFRCAEKVECEVESVEDALLAAKTGADIVMFDNMTPELIREAISALEEAGLRGEVTLEISGGITSETVDTYAGLDVDVISMGALTHSVRCADVSLEVDI